MKIKRHHFKHRGPQRLFYGFALLSFINAAHAAPERLGKVAGWELIYRPQVTEEGGCVAQGNFGKKVFSLALLNKKGLWVLAIQQAGGWSGIEANKKYPVTCAYDVGSKWKMTGEGLADGVRLIGLEADFIEDLARSNVLTLMVAGQSSGRYNLKGTRKLTEALKACHRDKVLARLQTEQKTSESTDEIDRLNQQATQLYQKGKYSEAVKIARASLALAERELGKDHPKVGTILNNLAVFYKSQGQYSKAEALHQRALAIQEKSLGSEHQDVATSLNNLALLYASQDRYEKAEPLYQRALAIRKKFLEPEHPDVATSLNNLAHFYASQGRYNKAEPLYQRALSIWEKTLGSEHPRIATGLNNLALLYASQGRSEEAEKLYQRSLKIREQVLGKDHPDVAISLNNLATLYSSQGRNSEAESLYQSALDIITSNLGSEHPLFTTVTENIAQLHEPQNSNTERERSSTQEPNDLQQLTSNTEETDAATTSTEVASITSLTKLASLEIPAAPAQPFLDIKTLTQVQWDGAVAAAMEGMRLVYGPMSEAEEAEFVRTWGVLRQHPVSEAVDYLNRFNPLLGEFLSLRGAVADGARLYEKAMAEVALAAELGDELISMQSTALAGQYLNILVSYQQRLDQVVQELVALGSPPDGAALMAQGQKNYQRARRFLDGLLDSGPVGEWIGYIQWHNGFKSLSKFGISHQPLHMLIDKYEESPGYYAILLDTGDYDEKSHKYVESLDLKRIPLVNSIKGDTLRHDFVDEEGYKWVFFAQRQTNASLPIIAEVAPKRFTAALESSLEKSGANLEFLSNQSVRNLGEDLERLAATAGVGIRHQMVIDTVQEVFRHYQLRPAFHAAAKQWMSIPPEQKSSNEQDRLRQFDALITANNPGVGSDIKIDSMPIEAVNDSGADQDENTAVLITHNEEGDVLLQMVDDKSEDERKALDEETIAFHQANIDLIRRNLEKDQQELQETTDPERRHDYELRILNAKANLQAEQDRIDTIRTGTIVHRRSPWDDYARSQFLQNISENQRKIEKVERSMERAMSMAESLPFTEAQQVLEIVSNGFSTEVMTAADTAAASRVIQEAYTVSRRYWESELAKANADAEWADTGLQTTEFIKSAADVSMMGLSFVGGSGINQAYLGITGYVEGGPQESFLRVAGSYNSLTGVLVDAHRGFEVAVQNGGGWEEGFYGAGREAVKGIIIEQAMKLGVRGVVGGYGMLKNTMASSSPTASITTTATGKPDNTVALTKPVQRPSRIPDDGFNRPLTSAERSVYRKKVNEARIEVDRFRRKHDQLQAAQRDNAPISEIKSIFGELDQQAARIHASPQAKMIMKTHQRNPRHREMIKRYSNSMDRVHRRVERRFNDKMAENNWTRESINPIRNQTSERTVNMDFDAAREVQHDASGRAIAPKKNGHSVPEAVWQTEAQQQWNDAYQDVTGQSAHQSWEAVTTRTHPEAYRDLVVLEENGILDANRRWSEQTVDVNQFKADHLRGSPGFDRIQKHVEISRSTAKEMDRRLFPLMESKTPPKSDKANYEAFQRKKAYWKKIHETMAAMGDGRLDPLDADRRIRELSGGKSSLEVTQDLRNFMESIFKLTDS